MHSKPRNRRKSSGTNSKSHAGTSAPAEVPYELPRLAKAVSAGEITAVVVAWALLLVFGWWLAHVWAVPKFWSTALVIVLGSATVGQLIIERWAGHVDGHLDTESRRRRVTRKAELKKTVAGEKAKNLRLKNALTTVVFWLAVATTVVLGASLAGEAAEAKLTCYEPDLWMSSLVPTWQANAVCEAHE